ncbi:hypothetical protein D3C86_1740930 [compost metagenome]
MVRTTTAPKAIAPPPGMIVASAPARTSEASSATTKISSIDQRPMISTSQYSRVCWRMRHDVRRCTETSSSVRIIIFSSGTTMLAISTTPASRCEPDTQR